MTILHQIANDVLSALLPQEVRHFQTLHVTVGASVGGKLSQLSRMLECPVGSRLPLSPHVRRHVPLSFSVRRT